MRVFSSVLWFTAISLVAAAPSYSQKSAAQAPPSQSDQPAPTLQINSRLVTVDVVVKKGEKAVTGLKESDFQVYEDGVRQTIRNFTPHFAGQASAAAAPFALPPDTWTDLPIAQATDSVTVLLLDGLNTPPAKMQFVRNAVIDYLKKERSGNRIAVFALGGQLRMLQGFTANSSQLLAALKKSSSTPLGSLLTPQQQNFTGAQQLQAMKELGMPSTELANTSNFMAEGDASQTAARVHLTLQALEQLSRYLAGVPGRKNLIWFSGSFPLNFFAIERVVMGESSNAPVKPEIMPIRSFDRELRQTADIMAATRIAVYPVDARGAMAEKMFTASAMSAATGPGDFTNSNPAMLNAGPEGGTVGTDEQFAPLQRMADHKSMDVIAQQTGGRAFYESNGLEQAISDAVSDGEDFYTLSYAPTNTNYNGALRTIVVRLPGAKKDKLFYRRNYYADPGTSSGNGKQQSGNAAFLASMAPGAPSSSQVVFDVRLTNPEPPAGPVAGQVSAMNNRAVRYSIDYKTRLGAIDLPQDAGGVRRGSLTALAIAYNSEGKPLNWVQNQISIALSQSDWNRDNTRGLPIHQVLDLPAGEVYLRVGLYDPGSGRIGSLEIPLHVTAQP